MTAYSQTQKTVMDPYFKRKGIFVIFLIFLTFMVLTNLTNDSVNILTTVLPTLRGWSQSAITLPLSVGGWLAIPVLLITGTLIKRIGAFNCLRIGFVILAVSTFCIGFFPFYKAYFVAIVFTRSAQAMMMFASLKICADWFFVYRGRALGIVTIGPPISSAFLVPLLAKYNESFGFQTAYTILAGYAVVLFIVTFFMGKATPEDYGWQRDGYRRSKMQLDAMGMSNDSPDLWSIGKMIKKKEYWILTVCGAFAGMVNGSILMLFVPVAMSAGISLTQALVIFSIGNLLAIPASFISGTIDDKFGSKNAFLIVLLFTILMPLSTIALLVTKQVFFAYLTTFCIGVLAGCLLNINPSVKVWAFGNKAFVDFNRTAQSIEFAFLPVGATMLSIIYDRTGGYLPGFVFFAVIMVIVFGLVSLIKSHAPEVIGLESAKIEAENA